MVTDSPRSEQANADVLLWQTGYRVALALLAAVSALALRTAGILSLAPVARVTVGVDLADWLLGGVSIAYVALVLAIRLHVRRRGAPVARCPR